MSEIWRQELFDSTPGPPDGARGYPGRHVLQQKPGEPLEFFYIEREGGWKLPPHWDSRVKHWHDEQMAARP